MEPVKTIEVDINPEDGSISLRTPLAPTELVFWLEYLKMQVLTGDIKILDE